MKKVNFFLCLTLCCNAKELPRLFYDRRQTKVLQNSRRKKKIVRSRSCFLHKTYLSKRDKNPFNGSAGDFLLWRALSDDNFCSRRGRISSLTYVGINSKQPREISHVQCVWPINHQKVRPDRRYVFARVLSFLCLAQKILFVGNNDSPIFFHPTLDSFVRSYERRCFVSSPGCKLFAAGCMLVSNGHTYRIVDVMTATNFTHERKEPS